MTTSALKRIDQRAKFTGLAHGYKVLLTNTARVSDLGWIEPTLRMLEDPETRDLVPRQADNYLSIVPFPFISPGEVLFATGQGGGYVIPTPDEVVAAASAILARKAYADVARKLGAYGGVERHAVVVVDEDKTSTFSWLRRAQPRDLEQLPAPRLPEEITHLWIMPRDPEGLTIWWSAKAGWQCVSWDWGSPTDALNAWADPVCPVNHRSDSSG